MRVSMYRATTLAAISLALVSVSEAVRIEEADFGQMGEQAYDLPSEITNLS